MSKIDEPGMLPETGLEPTASWNHHRNHWECRLAETISEDTKELTEHEARRRLVLYRDSLLLEAAKAGPEPEFTKRARTVCHTENVEKWRVRSLLDEACERIDAQQQQIDKLKTQNNHALGLNKVLGNNAQRTLDEISRLTAVLKEMGRYTTQRLEKDELIRLMQKAIQQGLAEARQQEG